MMHMIGIGPIPQEAIQFHDKTGGCPDEAWKEAVCEFLQYYLDYDNEEIQDLEIIETKKAAKDDIIYCVLGWVEDGKYTSARQLVVTMTL